MELKILIADDEISIRQLIKKLIDPSAPLHQGLGIPGLLQGHDGPAEVKGGLHGSASCSVCPDCITLPLCRQGAAGV